MVTTIQVHENTLELLKKIKEEVDASSYDDAITKYYFKHVTKGKSVAGILGKRSKQWIMKDLRDKRDRF